MITWNRFDTDCKSEWAIFTRLISLTGPIKCGWFSLVFVIKLGGGMTEIFSVGLQKADKGMKAWVNFVNM